MTAETLLELAARVEAASGADRELDCLIWCALNGVTEITYPTEGHPMTPGCGGRVEAKDADGTYRLLGWIDPGKVNRNWSSYGGPDAYPKFTASLDAAMTLVPEGWHSSVNTTEGAVLRGSAAVRDRDGGPSFTGAAATPALALTAACLRARAEHDRRALKVMGEMNDGK